MCTASSQAATCAACASASENTATVRTPRRRAVRATRQAISPRFAISSLANIEGLLLGRPGRRAFLEECRDAFPAFGRDANVGDALRGGGEQHVIHGCLHDIGEQTLGC